MIKEGAKIILDRRVIGFAITTAAQIIKNKFKSNRKPDSQIAKESHQKPSPNVESRDKQDLEKMRQSLQKHVSTGQTSVIVSKNRSSKTIQRG